MVPTSNLLGKENKGFHIAMDGLNGGRVNIGKLMLTQNVQLHPFVIINISKALHLL